MTESISKIKYHFLEGGGEMGRLTREYDWSNTCIGDPCNWPPSLRTTVSILLSSKFPMFLWWGENMIQFYNDAYRPSLGNNGKHPKALGQYARECWPEIWDIIYPLIRQVQTTGEATWSEDQLVPIYRNGRIEDVYWTFGYSAIKDDDGNVQGVLVVCNETTEKVQTLKKLEISNQRFRNMVMQAPVAVAVFRGNDLVAEIANDMYMDIIGKHKEDFEGKPLFVSLPETKETLEPIIKNVICTGVPYHSKEFKVALNRNEKSGYAYFNFVYEPLREEDGTIDGFMTVAHDVTTQVQARKNLEKSEERIRILVESAPFPIGVYLGREMRIELANQAMIKVWGKGADVVGKLYLEILPELEHQHAYEQLDSVFTTGIPFHAKNQRIELIENGSTNIFYFNYSLIPLFDSAGNVYGVMNTAADVTDLNLAAWKIKESEQNLRNTILQAPVAMCIFKGPQHIVELANKRMFELWGKEPGEVMNKPVFEGVSESRNQGLEAALESVFKTGITYSATDIPVKLKRGGAVKKVYINVVYEAYKEMNGVVSGILAVATDVTEQVLARHKIEEVVSDRTRELAEVNSSLAKSNADLAQFAYIASHDLQEPLRKVGIFTQMLEHSLGPVIEPRAKSYLEKISYSTSRMTKLIRDVLGYSQLSKQNKILERVNLQEVILTIVTDFELLIEQKHAIVNCRDLPTVDAIPLQMSQLFSNLLSNALKFSRKDTAPVIDVSAKIVTGSEVETSIAIDKERDYYLIKFCDNGIGFKQEYEEKIFNIFQRLHRAEDYAGTGIGLALCKKIAQNHHGDIYAKADPAGGAAFYIVLPKYKI